ncbi:SAM-dependent methyltransferase [Nguyenibacter sp. L1]|uniref:SAM-dependent methyltransferase n=1 Tax=Nguyenibacter sp. L1 TaxID=3049350 RepID=UPI002B48881A|nr:SAM-dependent methyltransferase [Nguyenibacter sp. L1]WRH86816.1 SAM-dependent methyltransferase [Nguyenibacter sp. L1]
MSERAARFDQFYAADIDPWHVRTSAYERRKYRATLAALPQPRYARGIEAGCAIGELTHMLSYRCDSLTAMDVSTVALAEAVRRNADRPNIIFLRAEIPDAWPTGMPADLIVLSEILYFLSPAELVRLARRIATGWYPGGHCVLVNYLGSTGEILQGNQAADLLVAAMAAQTGIRHDGPVMHDRYRLDILTHEGP